MMTTINNNNKMFYYAFAFMGVIPHFLHGCSDDGESEPPTGDGECGEIKDQGECNKSLVGETQECIWVNDGNCGGDIANTEVDNDDDVQECEEELGGTVITAKKYLCESKCVEEMNQTDCERERTDGLDCVWDQSKSGYDKCDAREAGQEVCGKALVEINEANPKDIVKGYQDCDIGEGDDDDNAKCRWFFSQMTMVTRPLNNFAPPVTIVRTSKTMSMTTTMAMTMTMAMTRTTAKKIFAVDPSTPIRDCEKILHGMV